MEKGNGFKFLFYVFDLRILEKELETFKGFKSLLPTKWGGLDPLSLGGFQVFIPQGFDIYIFFFKNTKIYFDIVVLI